MNLATLYRDTLREQERDICRWIEARRLLTPTQEQQAVLADSLNWRAAIFGRRAGKTTLLCLESLHKASEQDRQNILYLVPGVHQADPVLLTLSELARRAELEHEIRNNSVMLSNNSTIYLRPVAETSRARGLSCDLLCIDEIAHISIPIEAIMGMAFALAAQEGKILIAFTPAIQRQHNVDIRNHLAGLGFSIHRQVTDLVENLSLAG